MSASPPEDRAIGALLGLAVGDAVGTTLEFTTRDARPPLTDMVGGGPFNLEPGQWTDDTAMALALADSLLKTPAFDAHDLMKRFRAWRVEGRYSCTGDCFDIGIATSQAIDRFVADGDPFAGSTDPWAAGNGSLMRLAPVPITYRRDEVRRRAVAGDQSRTTHGAAEAIDACIYFADLIAAAIDGASKSDVLSPRPAGYAGLIDDIAGGRWSGKARHDIESSGYLAHSLEAALWCTATTETFRDAVLLAANLGGDADTTAAITGQLVGAIYGRSAIPPEWIDKVAWGDEIAATAGALFRMG